MKRIIACSVLMLGLCVGGSSYASQELENIDQNINQIKTELSGYQETQAQIENINAQTENLSGQLNELKTTEAAVSEEVGNLSNTYEAEKAAALDKVNEVYNGEKTYEEMLLSSENVTDYFDQVNQIKEVVAQDPQKLDQLKRINEGLSNKTAELENVQDQIPEVETKINDLKSQVPNYDEVKGHIDTLTAQLNTLETQRAELAAAEEKASMGNRLVEKAKEYLGTPYVWGGTTPNGFDCSGFVQYVYRQLGISIPRVTTGQEWAGIDVTGQELAAGDLVLWGARGNTHHVGMYIGNGQYIHSPQTGDVVKISNLRNYSVARRIVY